jgi:hypothetical protein
VRMNWRNSLVIKEGLHPVMRPNICGCELETVLSTEATLTKPTLGPCLYSFVLFDTIITCLRQCLGHNRCLVNISLGE